MLSHPTVFGSPVGLKHNPNPPRLDFSMPIFGEGHIQFLSLNYIDVKYLDELSTTHTILTPKGSTSTRDGCTIAPRGHHYYTSSEPGFRFIFNYEFFAITTLESSTYNDYGKAVGSTVAAGEYEILCAIDSYRHYFSSYDHPTDARYDSYYLRLYPYGSRGCIYDGTYLTGTGGYLDVVPTKIDISYINSKHYWNYFPSNYMYSNYVANVTFETVMLYDQRMIEAIDSIRFVPVTT